MPKPDEDDYSGTPCPAGPPLPLAFLDDEDDDDDTFEDITMALPDDSRPFLSMHRRKKEPKGLREPPRRITGYVPTVPAKDKLVVVAEKSKLVVKEVADAGEMHPVEPARMKLAEPEKRPQAVGGGVGKKDPERQAHTRRADMEPLPPQPPQPPLAQQLEPEPRHYAGGIHQQPQRTRGGITKAPSRRRVSAILKAKKEQDRAPNPILSEKTINSPIIKLAQKQSLVAQKLIQPPKRRLFKPAPALAKQQPQKLASWRDRTSGKENAAPADRKRALGRSPPRKSARLSDVPARVPMRAVAKSVPLSIKPVERSRKRVSDDISFDEGDSSFTSQVSGYTEAPGSLRLKKRFKSSMGSLPSPPGLTQEEENEILPPSKTLLPGLTSYRPQANRKRPLDPVLNDDIERCEMYEESWLSAQESSVSQLLNQLLSQYSPAPVGKRRLALRKEFLVLYAAAPFPMIYNRVHASLLYGALSITQAILDKSSVARISRPASTATGHLGWGADIGTRQGFLELFMGSYEQSALITALEVVVGREMFAYMQPGESEKKVLEAYLDRYIIRSEDILSTVPEPAQGSRKGAKMGGHSAEDEDRGTPAWLLRRSMLRSLMVIILLDKAKARGILGRQCLFKKVGLVVLPSAITRRRADRVLGVSPQVLGVGAELASEAAAAVRG